MDPSLTELRIAVATVSSMPTVSAKRTQRTRKLAHATEAPNPTNNALTQRVSEHTSDRTNIRAAGGKATGVSRNAHPSNTRHPSTRITCTRLVFGSQPSLGTKCKVVGVRGSLSVVRHIFAEPDRGPMMSREMGSALFGLILCFEGGGAVCEKPADGCWH